MRGYALLLDGPRRRLSRSALAIAATGAILGAAVGTAPARAAGAARAAAVASAAENGATFSLKNSADAGDYLKFAQTTSYTADLLLAGVRDFPNQMGAGSSSANFTAEAKFGADWLLRMWDDPTATLYYQVGIGEGNASTVGDHDIWRLPQADDTYGGADPTDRYIRNRPVFRAGPPGSLISPNLAGRDAAALAEAFQVYKTSDPTFADRCLLLPAGLPHTDPLFYLGKSAHWANAYITGPNDAADTLNLYDVSGLAHYELYRAISQAGNPPGLEVTQAGLLADLKKQLDKAVAQGATEPFGFGFPWDVYDTTSHGAGLSVMASEYDQLTGTQAYGPSVSSGWRTSSARMPGARHLSSATGRRSRIACSTRSPTSSAPRRCWPARLWKGQTVPPLKVS